MSLADRFSVRAETPGWFSTVDETAARYVRRLGRATFGDRTGLTIFLGALALYMLYWRVDVFIVDTFVIADTLVALSRGTLAIETIVFSPESGVVPGMHVVDGTLYGRSYGLAALSLPALWAMRGLSLVFDLRVLLAGVWSLVVLAFATQLGHVYGRERVATLGGAALALGLFAANVLTATPLPRWVLPLVSLQVTTMIAAALVGVVMYRLVASRYSNGVAVFAGAAAVVLSPIGFWASIPKRHVPLALLALVSLFLFARSRDVADPRSARRYRAAMYAPVGLSAWISSPEGLILLAALLPSDLLTAQSNSRREVLAVVGVLAFSLLPFFLTNVAISGDPLAPPALLPYYNGAVQTAASSTGSSGAAGGAGSAAAGGGSGTPQLVAIAATVLGGVERALGRLSIELGRGMRALDPTRLYHVFIRSGRIPGVDYSMTGGETVELTLFESAPLLAAVVALPVAAVSNLRTRPGLSMANGRQLIQHPVAATDLFAVTYVVLLSLVYLPRLPLHATITVRYLVPIVPFLLYAVVRLSTVRDAVDGHGDQLLRVTAILTVVGVVTSVVAFGLANLSVGSVVQVTAVVNLLAGGLVAGWAVAATRRELPSYIGLLALALALAGTTTFLILSGVEYFGHGRQFALPVTRLLEQLIPIR